MPKDPRIKKVLVIGSGPIIIGQAAEFDYSGTQACRALKAEGIETVLLNSNPATIMTDPDVADHVYIEPMTLEVVERILDIEKPDSVLPNLGGQMGLNLSMELARSGYLDRTGIRLLACKPETIDRAEDRELFKETMEKLHQPIIPSEVVETLQDALACADRIGYPVIVRPAFTMGGTGGGICENKEKLIEIGTNGLRLSPIHQILVEKCIAGWKEIEYEVMRDHKGNVITVCNMENLDPVGIHTGDSVVVAPSQTLTDYEYQMLRTAALDIITELGIEGGCNCQFALNPESFEYAVIEVNPRVSRSSALASKATGYPIAKVATKIAVGYTLDEIRNVVTGNTYAAFEPALDYVAVKFPKWPFEKFVYAERTLGTQMKATGEVMSISDSFESAIMKAVRGAEISTETLGLAWTRALTDGELKDRIHVQDDSRLFVVYEALRRGITVEEIHGITKIDEWFLWKLRNIADYEKEIEGRELTKELCCRGRRLGFTDRALEKISGHPVPVQSSPVYRMVDTCAGEFAAQTPYFYGVYSSEEEGGENEVLPFIRNPGKTVVVFGSGPIRIGQGIEFDYASVHCVQVLKELGYEVVIVNNNPETVSTDFDTADRLYFEPLTVEDVKNILQVEKPCGVVVAFGGQTAIRLTRYLAESGVPIIGTCADSIDMAEDRERFDELLDRLHIAKPKGHTVMTEEEAIRAAESVGYPVLMRPSYVLGGQNMIIAFDEADIREYMKIILAQNIENPVLIDKYLEGTEIEVDAIYDGTDVLLPGIMEHVERSGIHSGDSIAIYPAMHLTPETEEKIAETTKKLCEGLNAVGIVNVQYIVADGEIYIIEVNPRASRTVPYLSKVTGVPMVDLAVKASLGMKLRDLGFGTGLYKKSRYTAVKVPVFSFEKLIDVDVQLGPEMKSTGEVLGISRSYDEALLKAFDGAGVHLPKDGKIIVTVRDKDKAEICEMFKNMKDMQFRLYATPGTRKALMAAGVPAEPINKISGDSPNIHDMLAAEDVSLIINTPTHGRLENRDGFKLRRLAVEAGCSCLTSLDAAKAIMESTRIVEADTVNLTDIATL